MVDIAATAPTIADRLQKIGERRWPAAFSHVVEAAQPFVVAAMARTLKARLWVLCPTIRAQESFHDTLTNWVPSADFLPEAEFGAVQNILPDPEIGAERLSLLAKLDHGISTGVVVTTRASLDQAAPKKGSLRGQTLILQRGGEVTMESLLQKLIDAGYQRIAQVHTRGQFAVRGGIVDLFSWQD